MTFRLPIALLIALSASLVAGAASAEAPQQTFGFSGMEFYKLDWDTQDLRIADVNGDGLKDIVVANNAKARIDCLIQRAKTGAVRKPEQGPAVRELSAAGQAPEPNEVPNDSRYENRPFLAEKKVFSLELGDLNGDGRADMAYYGDPRELVVVYQDGQGGWGARRTFDIADGSAQPNAMAIGDLNGDGRNDIVLLGTDGVYFIYQNKDGKLEAPVKDAGLPEGVVAVLAGDFNGDHRADLLYLCLNETAPFCFRFQGADGRLGPEIRCKAAPVRALAVGDIDGDGADETLSIQSASGRLVVYKTVLEAATGGLLEGPFERYTLRTTGSRKPRSMTFGPISDPNRLDVVVTDPDAAEVEIFSQTAPGLWNRRASFPSLQAATDVAVLRVGDKPGLLILSPEEPMLGLATMEPSGRLTFPRALPAPGKPTCMTVGDLNGDGKTEIICATTQDKDHWIRILEVDPTGAVQEKSAFKVEDCRADPDGLLIADANQDGLNDIILFTPYQEMRIFKAAPEGKYVDVSRGADYGKGLVQGARLKSVGLADVNGDGKKEILLATKNFARALRLDEKDRLVIVDQFNGRSPTSQIVAAAAADLDGDGKDEILLADAGTRCLTALKQNAKGVYEIADNFQTGPINPERLVVTDLTGDPKPEVLLLGQNDFTVLQPGAPRTVLREIASYETPVRNGRLENLTVGSLTGDGRKQVLASEGTKEAMEILVWEKEGPKLRRALSWPVFEAKTFGGSRFGRDKGPSSEPREFEIGDVTGGGKADIILLIHDRILVYPQE